MAKKYKQIAKKVQNRLKNEIIQTGGDGLRQNQFSSDGDFGNMITQLAYFIENGVASIIDGTNAVYSIATLPQEFMSITGKHNEPLPSTTLISRVINII
jgi:hypothetical protein